MRFTQIFKVKDGNVSLKHDMEGKGLFGTALGTTDEYEWTSTGFTFEDEGNTPEHNLARWLEVIIGFMELRKTRLSKDDVTALCVFINGIANGQDIQEARRRAVELEAGSTSEHTPFVMYLAEALRQMYTEMPTKKRTQAH